MKNKSKKKAASALKIKKRWKILVADDVDPIAQTVAEYLRLEGDIDVLIERKGLQVADVAAKWLPDLIVLDIFFDTTDKAHAETDVFPEIRRREKLKDVPVLMLTRFMSEDAVRDANQLPEAGLKHYAIHGWSPSKIIGIIRKLLKSSERKKTKIRKP